MATVRVTDAVTALLFDRPGYGYEIKSRADAAFGAFGWDIHLSSIYGALQRLERAGRVRSGLKPRGRPDHRVVHWLTDDARAAAQQWANEPMHAHASHEELLVRLFYAGLAGPDALATTLDRWEVALLAELERVGRLRRDRCDTVRGLADAVAIEALAATTQARLVVIEFARERLPSLATAAS